MQSHSAENTDESFTAVRRVKRGWLWEPFFATEEQISPGPVYIGQLKSDLDKQDGNLEYILTGEGAGSIFFINEYNGTIYVKQKLDREEKPFYTLKAHAINRSTRLPVEPESEFIIKVRDVNDHEPQFLDGPYVATVPEMSPEEQQLQEKGIRAWCLIKSDVNMLISASKQQFMITTNNGLQKNSI
ncbi:hypothetical protein WISP_37697 [Willisornis vidua]|uniref:Cadherin domain-containing protein n=1 Tax=Willisornis vidua TaxID=1566151 RepID=A0ABQ9DHX3_9PASS|nr:hypothetical protein WISP_37697 [Willisornis vidua]